MCGGLSILDLIQGYDRVVVVDSIQTDGLSPGKIHRLELSDLKNTVHLSWPHEINFATAIELGKKLLIHLPTIIDIYAIEIKKSITFSEECSAEISKAIPGIVEEILAHQSRIH
jgi:hydrogenase maturation protease